MTIEMNITPIAPTPVQTNLFDNPFTCKFCKKELDCLIALNKHLLSNRGECAKKNNLNF